MLKNEFPNSNANGTTETTKEDCLFPCSFLLQPFDPGCIYTGPYAPKRIMHRPAGNVDEGVLHGCYPLYKKGKQSRLFVILAFHF